MGYARKEIALGRLFLNSNNPRHDPIVHQADIIEHLCARDDVIKLALSIVRVGGINPMESTGVVKNTQSKAASYIVWEGNRRVCALKILRDPELAPSRSRNRIRKAIEARGFKPLTKLETVVFDTSAEMRDWLLGLHAGEQGGLGRKGWDAQQVERFLGKEARNPIALAIFDLIERTEILSARQLKGKYSVIDRYTMIKQFKDALGLDDIGAVPTTSRDPKDLISMLQIFAKDIMSKEVNTRQNEPEITPYAINLIARAGVGSIDGSPIEIDEIELPEAEADVVQKKGQPPTNPSAPNSPGGGVGTKPTAPVKPQKPVPPRRRTNIDESSELRALLVGKHPKLDALYSSICIVSANSHPLLLSVGAWSFIESLTTAMGKPNGNQLTTHFGKDRCNKLGFTDKGYQADFRTVLNRIADNGNMTKHSGKGGSYDAEQLISDFDVITPLLIAELTQNRS